MGRGGPTGWRERGKWELKFRGETRFLQWDVKSKEVTARGVRSGRDFLLHGRKLGWSFAGGKDPGEQEPADVLFVSVTQELTLKAGN